MVQMYALYYIIHNNIVVKRDINSRRQEVAEEVEFSLIWLSTFTEDWIEPSSGIISLKNVSYCGEETKYHNVGISSMLTKVFLNANSK